MEDLFKFLVIAAAIAVGIIKQFTKKEADSDTRTKPFMPTGDLFPEDEEDDYEEEKDYYYEEEEEEQKQEQETTCEDYIPYVLQDVPEPPRATPAPPTPRFTRYTPIEEHKPAPAPTAANTEYETDDEYHIHSIEEARRAIIWSEILQRKY